ncbi:extensin [Streptomyces physcomitrii]|uniref:Extensin n=1 Tax=Streptomyces physcomitrii TaxID=2724184 RepID=A0ABX1GXX7_9ACTN|nr:extensin [Streptomyces physcomitrii]NKI39914.1 extensin [Streptomyces physcomitrii]
MTRPLTPADAPRPTPAPLPAPTPAPPAVQRTPESQTTAPEQTRTPASRGQASHAPAQTTRHQSATSTGTGTGTSTSTRTRDTEGGSGGDGGGGSDDPPSYTPVPDGGFDPRALTDFQLDELTHRLTGRITRLLRTELRQDRERVGRLRDPRR